MPAAVPEVRITAQNAQPVAPDGDFVLYWMVASRRTRHSFALDRAVEHSEALGKPLLVLEALRTDYPFASDRHHAFVLAGMADNRAACDARGVTYHGYVEPEPGAGRGLIEALAARACVVVTDDWPCMFVPRMVEAAAAQVAVRVEAVDGNGLYPMHATDRVFGRAVDFRRYLQKVLADHLGERPSPDPLARARALGKAILPDGVATRWPEADDALLEADPARLALLPIDHGVPPSPVLRGGAKAGREVLESFLAERLPRYGTSRNHPDDDAASGLSPYLHFGHIGAHEVFDALVALEGWRGDDVSQVVNGKAGAWWGMSPAAESFLDELVTWRELGFNSCSKRPDDYDRFESLPDWVRKTLGEHRADPRPFLYTLDEFDEARTHDPIWNAAQNQLRTEGRMHNYLRMLWGKKILEWTPSPEHALHVMIELNNRYALDGRDPNSYSGIFWVLGRYDRPWAPARPVFGMIRFMSSDSTRKKLKLKGYLERYTPESDREPAQGALFGDDAKT
jgi:deoxyribodipyrimidine photo-lyase